MNTMNENLPVHVATHLSEVGSISYANEVIAIIAGMAASEIDGVATMGTGSSIADILGRGRRPITRGVKVEVGTEEASVDLVLTVDYGKPIQKVCLEVQESVRKSIETMTGLHVVKVDVHVQGVSFEREAKQLAEGSQHAKMDLGTPAAHSPVIEDLDDAFGDLDELADEEDMDDVDAFDVVDDDLRTDAQTASDESEPLQDEDDGREDAFTDADSTLDAPVETEPTNATDTNG